MDERNCIAIKPHHFIDILMDVGRGHTDWRPMPDYGHALHTVARQLMADRDVRIRVEQGIDDICEPCVHHVGERCDDVRARPPPGQSPSKMEWNLMLDKGWCDLLGLQQGQVLTAREFCEKARELVSLAAMKPIYPGQPGQVSQERYHNLVAGLAAFCGRHRR